MIKEEQWDALAEQTKLERQERFRQQALEECKEHIDDSIKLEERIQERIQELQKEHEEAREQRWQEFIEETKRKKEDTFRLQALRESEEHLNVKSLELHKVADPIEEEISQIDQILVQIRNMQSELISLERAVLELKKEK